MNKIYLIITIGLLVMGAYFYGVNITNAKCQIRQTEQQNKNATQIIQNQRVIHDTVYKTGLVDIRRILHDKYTIAE